VTKHAKLLNELDHMAQTAYYCIRWPTLRAAEALIVAQEKEIERLSSPVKATEEEIAVQLALHGQCFTVDGVLVPPSDVQIYRAPVAVQPMGACKHDVPYRYACDICDARRNNENT
jgi:hypothetical protein